MERFVIEGGKALSGGVTPGGSKNEALPCLAACLLTPEPVMLKNLPNIADVRVMLEVMEALGCAVEWLAEDTVRVTAADIRPEIDAALARRIRASILFAGPLLARLGQVKLPPPGGDVIGRRRLDTHFLGFEALGATHDLGDVYDLRAKPALKGAEIFFDEASVTATENVIMAAALAEGRTVLMNAACEPHVQGLCRQLVSMGAEIGGIGTNTLRIMGSKRLHGTTHTIGPDYLEIGSWMGLAAVTNSDITIHDARPDELRMILTMFNKLGVFPEIGEHTVRIAPDQPLEIRRDLHGAIPRIDDAPWPAFPTDLMSIAITVATQAKGTVLFFEKMFEGRMFFTDHLIGMGASIILCDPHRIVVVGPSQLYGTTLESPDVRAGMALLIASLAAKGRSTIYNIRQIDRGYVKIDEKLRALGASILREDV
ncbi:MAG: UDP-N-acetylglucosamine 1-carboxyvinyltransferase [Proteobacteria bacterium]|nr:MAG: UDP-N-acetylglucosamine 1-carboxyvinyltransferase [Pseudomonadota bacterium]